MPSCEHCNSTHSESAKYCPACGKKITSGNTAAVHPTLDAPPMPAEGRERVGENKYEKNGETSSRSNKKKNILIAAVLVLLLAIFAGVQYINNSSTKETPRRDKVSDTTTHPSTNSNLASQKGSSNTAAVVPEFAHKVGSRVQQVLLVSGSSTNSSAQLDLWETSGTSWVKKSSHTAVVGKNGLASANEKSEGDNKTPRGTYALGPAFGYASRQNTKMDYRQLTDDDYWVDDPRSSQYNRWVKGRPAANSYEKLKRSDQLHQLGIVILYNTDPVVAGKGSAIFLHVWREYNIGTAGGVAVSLGALQEILQWLEPSKHPHIVIGP